MALLPEYDVEEGPVRSLIPEDNGGGPISLPDGLLLETDEGGGVSYLSLMTLIPEDNGGSHIFT